MKHLEIRNTWDGTPIEESEAATVAISPVEDATGDLWLRVEAPFHDDPPPPKAPGPTPALWNFEVVEIFISGDGGYTEIELGPHGHHLVLRLGGVRVILEEGLPLQFSSRSERHRWRGEARVPAAYLPPPPWRANAYAIHGEDGDRRYLAHSPPGGPRPDFHRLESFVPLNLTGC